MKSNMIAFLAAKPSYLRWSAARLAERFECSERTASQVKKTLKETLNTYNSSFSN